MDIDLGLVGQQLGDAGGVVGQVGHLVIVGVAAERLEQDPEEVGPYVECQKNYAGYQYKDTVGAWFSAAIGKEVFAIRAPLRRRTRLNPKRLIFDRQDDLRKSFCSDAAFHVVNKQSVLDLAERVK